MSIETDDLEKRRQALFMELESRKHAAAGKGERFDFNNLKNKLPGGSTRWAADFSKMIDTPMHNRNREYGSEVSELSFNTTPREFFAQVDSIIDRLEAEHKIDMVRINKLHQIIESSLSGRATAEEAREAIRQSEEALEPLYIELRLLGYSHYDLWE